MTTRSRTTRPPTAAVAAVLAAALAGATAPASAQRPDTLRITLDEAYQIAEGYNPTYRRSVNDLDLNGVQMQSTWLTQVLPRASVTLFNTGFTGNITRRGVDNLGNPIANPQADWVYYSQTSQGLNLRWDLQGRNIFNALSRQERTNQRRETSEDLARLDVRFAVRQQFFEVLEQGELLEMEQQLEQDRRLDLELARRLYELAERTRVDVLNAELDVGQQGLAIQQQEAQYEQAMLALRRLLGDDGLGALSLEGTPVTIFDPTPLDADVLVDQAYLTNQDLRSAEASQEIADIDVRDAKNAWWPNLSLSFNVSRTAQTAEGDALFDVSYDEDLDSRFSVSMSLPFFNDYFGNRRRIQEAQVGLSNQRESLREQRLAVEERVRTAVLALENQYQGLLLAQRSLEIAEEALRLAREEYRLGSRSFQDLRSSIQQEADARRQVIQNRYGFADAHAQLERAVGAAVTAPPLTDGTR